MEVGKLQSIAVIVVNYNAAELAVEAVQSVLSRSHGGRAVSVHLVDNASPDGGARQLRDAHSAHGWGARVQLYLETENHGFGRGNNLVIRALAASDTPPDAVFLLNPDAALENEAIDILATMLEADPLAGFAGAGIALPNGVEVTAAFRFPSVISEFSGSLGFGPVSRLLRRWEVPLPPSHPAGRVDWVAGAAVLMRMQALRALNFFDPGFFLYYEEVDLMHRGQLSGWHCLYGPQARVVHAEGQSTGVKSDRAVPKRLPDYHYYSWQYYYRRIHGRSGAYVAALARVLGAAGNCGLAFLRRRPRQAPPYFFVDFWAYSIKPLLKPLPDTKISA